MPKYTFTYFDGFGLGEPIRLLLAYGKVEFEDRRIDYENEWPQVKPTAPFGQLPLLEFDGKVLFQSLSIGRYLAKKFGLYSADPLEAFEIDVAVDIVNDLRAKLADSHYESDEAVKARKWQQLQDETIPFYLKKLEGIAKANDGHLALKKVTWADVYFAGLEPYLKSMVKSEMKADFIGKFPNLRKSIDNALAQPGIKEWVEKRPKSEW